VELKQALALSLWLAFLGTGCAAAQTVGGANTAGGLNEACNFKSNEERQIGLFKTMCEAYITGVAHGLSVAGAYASDPRLVPCLPRKFVSGREAKRLFQDYLRQHPEVARELAANVIAVALSSCSAP
jgi:hypothetical protein